MSDEQRLTYINGLEGQKTRGSLPYDLVDIIADLRVCFLDKELWPFLVDFGDPILQNISPSQEPATDKEEEVAKTLETYKQARESTNFPIPSEEEQKTKIDYARSYFSTVIEIAEQYKSKVENILVDLSGHPAKMDVADLTRFQSELRSFATLYLAKSEPQIDMKSSIREMFSRLLELIDDTDKIVFSEDGWKKAPDMYRSILTLLTQLWAVSTATTEQIQNLSVSFR